MQLSTLICLPVLNMKKKRATLLLYNLKIVRLVNNYDSWCTEIICILYFPVLMCQWYRGVLYLDFLQLCSMCSRTVHINWEDKLLSAEVINISRVIKLSLSSHDILPPSWPLLLFFSLKSSGKRTGGLLHWRTSPVFVVRSLFSNCLGLLTRPKPEISA